MPGNHEAHNGGEVEVYLESPTVKRVCLPFFFFSETDKEVRESHLFDAQERKHAQIMAFP